MLLGGCATGPLYQKLTPRDVVVIPEARISKTFHSSDRTDAGIEFGASRASGKTEVEAQGSGQVRLGDTTFTGPQLFTTTFDFAMYDLSLRWREFMRDLPFGYEFTGGLGYANLKMALSSTTGRATESVSSPVFRMRLGGIWRVVPSTRIELGVTAIGTKSVFDRIGGVDVSIAQTLGPHLTLRGGYLNWQVDSPGTSRSRIELRFYGPSVGLGLHF